MVAVPLAVAKSTVTVPPLAGDRLTVNVAVEVPLLPSAMLTSLMKSVGGGGTVVVGDRSDALTIQNRSVRRTGQIDVEVFGPFERGVVR